MRDTETKEEAHHRQCNLLSAIIANVESHLLSRSHLWPEDWDGHELRELIADAYDRERTNLMRESRRCRSGRYRHYRNTALVERLY